MKKIIIISIILALFCNNSFSDVNYLNLSPQQLCSKEIRLNDEDIDLNKIFTGNELLSFDELKNKIIEQTDFDSFDNIKGKDFHEWLDEKIYKNQIIRVFKFDEITKKTIIKYQVPYFLRGSISYTYHFLNFDNFDSLPDSSIIHKHMKGFFGYYYDNDRNKIINSSNATLYDDDLYPFFQAHASIMSSFIHTSDDFFKKQEHYFLFKIYMNIFDYYQTFISKLNNQSYKFNKDDFVELINNDDSSKMNYGSTQVKETINHRFIGALKLLKTNTSPFYVLTHLMYDIVPNAHNQIIDFTLTDHNKFIEKSLGQKIMETGDFNFQKFKNNCHDSIQNHLNLISDITEYQYFPTKTNDKDDIEPYIANLIELTRYKYEPLFYDQVIYPYIKIEQKRFVPSLLHSSLLKKLEIIKTEISMFDSMSKVEKSKFHLYTSLSELLGLNEFRNSFDRIYLNIFYDDLYNAYLNSIENTLNVGYRDFHYILKFKVFPEVDQQIQKILKNNHNITTTRSKIRTKTIYSLIQKSLNIINKRRKDILNDERENELKLSQETKNDIVFNFYQEFCKQFPKDKFVPRMELFKTMLKFNADYGFGLDDLDQLFKFENIDEDKHLKAYLGKNHYHSFSRETAEVQDDNIYINHFNQLDPDEQKELLSIVNDFNQQALVSSLFSESIDSDNLKTATTKDIEKEPDYKVLKDLLGIKLLFYGEINHKKLNEIVDQINQNIKSITDYKITSYIEDSLDKGGDFIEHSIILLFEHDHYSEIKFPLELKISSEKAYISGQTEKNHATYNANLYKNIPYSFQSFDLYFKKLKYFYTDNVIADNHKLFDMMIPKHHKLDRVQHPRDKGKKSKPKDSTEYHDKYYKVPENHTLLDIISHTSPKDLPDITQVDTLNFEGGELFCAVDTDSGTNKNHGSFYRYYKVSTSGENRKPILKQNHTILKVISLCNTFKGKSNLLKICLPQNPQQKSKDLNYLEKLIKDNKESFSHFSSLTKIAQEELNTFLILSANNRYDKESKHLYQSLVDDYISSLLNQYFHEHLDYEPIKEKMKTHIKSLNLSAIQLIEFLIKPENGMEDKYNEYFKNLQYSHEYIFPLKKIFKYDYNYENYDQRKDELFNYFTRQYAKMLGPKGTKKLMLDLEMIKVFYPTNYELKLSYNLNINNVAKHLNLPNQISKFMEGISSIYFLETKSEMPLKKLNSDIHSYFMISDSNEIPKKYVLSNLIENLDIYTTTNHLDDIIKDIEIQPSLEYLKVKFEGENKIELIKDYLSQYKNHMGIQYIYQNEGEKFLTFTSDFDSSFNHLNANNCSSMAFDEETNSINLLLPSSTEKDDLINLLKITNDLFDLKLEFEISNSYETFFATAA